MRSSGCSIKSLLLLTSLCAVVFGVLGIAVRSTELASGPPLDTAGEVVAAALILLPLCGLLIGHVRFQRVQYMVLGTLMGFVVGALLLAVLAIPADAVVALAIVATPPTLALVAYGFYVRRG